MKNKNVIHAVFGLILSLFGHPSKAQEADRPWFEAAQKVEQAASFDEMRKILKNRLPGYLESIETDAVSHREILDLWGLSRNIDESHLGDGTRTVPANVIQFLNSILQVNYDENFVYGHAGLTHTYGYLLSNLRTPFGFKRARYVGGEIEAGFGLPAKLFSGQPSQGTLLDNLTHFAAQIAFRDQPKIQKSLRSAIAEIANYPFQELKPKRLVERLRSDDYHLELRTDLIPFPKTILEKNTHLLIYSIDFRKRSEDPKPRLITVFPVQKSFVDGVFSNIGFGDRQPIKLKYNASVPIQISHEDMIGKRYIADENHVE